MKKVTFDLNKFNVAAEEYGLKLILTGRAGDIAKYRWIAADPLAETALVKHGLSENVYYINDQEDGEQGKMNEELKRVAKVMDLSRTYSRPVGLMPRPLINDSMPIGLFEMGRLLNESLYPFHYPSIGFGPFRNRVTDSLNSWLYDGVEIETIQATKLAQTLKGRISYNEAKDFLKGRRYKIIMGFVEVKKRLPKKAEYDHAVKNGLGVFQLPVVFVNVLDDRYSNWYELFLDLKTDRNKLSSYSIIYDDKTDCPVTYRYDIPCILSKAKAYVISQICSISSIRPYTNIAIESLFEFKKRLAAIVNYNKE